MDRIKLHPDGVALREEVVNRDHAPVGHYRIDNLSQQGCKTLTIIYRVGECDCVRITAQKSDDGTWMIKSITANLPKILWGHNGRCIQNEAEFFLALTLLRHLVQNFARPEDFPRILPGIGHGNRGYIALVEITVQIADPGSRVLLASHSARYPKSQKPNGIYHGESTKIHGHEHSFSFYDKRKEMQLDPLRVDGEPVTVTRIERCYRTGRRLAAGLRQIASRSGNHVSTLSLLDAYRLLRSDLGKLNGFAVTTLPKPRSVDEGKTVVRLMAAMADNLPKKMRSLDALMAIYLQVNPCCTKTAASIRTGLGKVLAEKADLTLDELLPPDIRNLRWLQVEMPIPETKHRAALRDLGAGTISEPDPDVVHAFSETRLIEKVSGERVRLGTNTGQVINPCPWSKTR
jgi:hypothetical protein